MEKLFKHSLWRRCYTILEQMKNENVVGREHFVNVYEFFRLGNTDAYKFIDKGIDGRINLLKQSFIFIGEVWEPKNITQQFCTDLMFVNIGSQHHVQRLHRIINFGNISIPIRQKLIMAFPMLTDIKPRANRHEHEAGDVSKSFIKNDLVDKLQEGLKLDGEKFLQYYREFFPQIDELLELKAEKDHFIHRTEFMVKHLHEQSFNIQNFCSVWLFRDPEKKHPTENELDTRLKNIWSGLSYTN